MNDDMRIRISGYLDGELEPEERLAFERELAADPELAREFGETKAMKEVTDAMKLRDFPDRVWERYWEGTYNRIERRVGWILLSIGAMILAAAGLYHAALALFLNSVEPLWLRLAVASACAGAAILFISVLRERLFLRRGDPYREIQR